MNNKISQSIQDLIQNHKIIIFMKGNKLIPMCHFSNTVIQILDKFNIDYHTINILDNEEIKKQVKIYSQWPTFPQVYIDGKLIGGADIVTDLYKTSKLHEILEQSINT